MIIKPDTDSAQVRIPPPLVLLVTLIGSVYVQQVYPFPFTDMYWRWGFGSVVAAIAFILFGTSVHELRAFRTSLPPWKPTMTIVTRGPFSFSRNPIYLAFLLLVLGTGFLLDSAYSLLLVIPLYCFLEFYVIRKEEKYLTGKFGNTYLGYQNAVRRWF